MRSGNYTFGKIFIARLEHGSELLKSITDFAKEKKIAAGVFSIIGAVKRARIGYYDQKNHEYITASLDEPLEIVSCIGNLSLKGGEPFAHVHVVFADSRGQTKAGHLIDATVFAAELHLQELIGPELVREHDDVTGLALWKL
jgi:hypothetical protein